MAKKITVQVVGGERKTVDGYKTVGELKEAFNVPRHTATLNGDSVSDATQLSDYSFVHLAPAVKGGN
jgi:hypothetical protein